MIDRTRLPAGLGAALDDVALLDRADRIDYLISVADQFRSVPAEVAVRPWPAEARVPQCESEVYVFSAPREDGTLDFHFAVDNPQGIAAKALAALLAESLSGVPLDDVLAVPHDAVYELFGRELSMGKNLGLTATLGLAQAHARHALAAQRGERSEVSGQARPADALSEVGDGS